MNRIILVCGDTKVVERGRCDGAYISTAGLGILPKGININGCKAIHGDSILILDPIATHGMAIKSLREELNFSAPIKSDTTALNEIASQLDVGMLLDESAIPIDPLAASACEMLGIDPLYIANEGCLIAICASCDAAHLFIAMRSHQQGRHSAIIGRVQMDPSQAIQLVQIKTRFSECRRVDWLAGEPLPRIC